MFENCVFAKISMTIIYVNVNIISVSLLTWNNAIRMRMFTSNSKHISFLSKIEWKKNTQKGEHSCKCTELSLKRKEGIAIFHW